MEHENDVPILCDVGAMNPEQRERYRAARRWLKVATEGIQELEDGYALKLRADASSMRRAAEFIGLESLCCPFLKLTLELAPAHGPLWLKMTGSAAAKDLLTSELGLTSSSSKLHQMAGE